MYGIDYEKNKTSLYRKNNIEVLSERLGSLQIINKALEEIYKQSDEEISVVPASVMTNNNRQAVIVMNLNP